MGKDRYEIYYRAYGGSNRIREAGMAGETDTVFIGETYAPLNTSLTKAHTVWNASNSGAVPS